MEKKEKISTLAVLETIAASIFAFLVASYMKDFQYIFLSSLFAPFILLRSDRSVRLGKVCFNRTFRFPQNSDPDWFFFKILFYPIVIRFFCTLRFIVPGVRNFPKNYLLNISVINSFHPVEFVPSAGSIFKSFKEGVRSKDNPFSISFYIYTIGIIVLALAILYISLVFDGYIKIFFILVFSFYVVAVRDRLIRMIIAFLASFLAFWIRFSIKSTAVIWLPILYLALRVPKDLSSTKLAIVEEKYSSLSSIIRLVAWSSLAFFVWRLVIFPSVYDIWMSYEVADALNIFVLPVGTEPDEISLWHIVSGLNALITLGFFYFIWEPLARHQVAINNNMYLIYLSVYWLRGGLSIYTIMCGFYYAAIGWSLISVPKVNWCLFPWLC